MSDLKDFVIENGELIEYIGAGGDVVIPKGVTDIWPDAFWRCKNLKSVTLPEGMVEFDQTAFRRGLEEYEGCTLECLIVPESIVKIGGSGLGKLDNISSIIAPSARVYNLVYRALNKTSKEKILRKALVTKNKEKHIIEKIKANKNFLIDIAIAEDDTAKAEYIASSVKRLNLDELQAFIQRCESAPMVRAFLIDYSNRMYSVTEKEKIADIRMQKEFGLRELSLAEWKKAFTLEETDTGEYVIKGYKGSNQAVVIPQKIGGKKVVGIAEKAFAHDVPKLREEVRKNRQSVTSVIIPDTVTSIASGAFWGCKNLTNIYIPDSVISIGAQAFYMCENLARVDIPDGLEIIEKETFYECKNLVEVNLSHNGITIDERAFKGCINLENIVIPQNANIISLNAFAGCKSMADENGFVIIQKVLSAYYGSDKSVAIPNGVETIGDGAFAENKCIENVTIPSGVRFIERSAFKGCTNLQSIDIPNTVNRVGFWAFGRCRNLRTVRFLNGNAIIETGAFDCCDRVIVCSAKGSAVENFAKNNHIPFKTEKTDV